MKNRILILEDDKKISLLMKADLELSGYKAQIFSSGDEIDIKTCVKEFDLFLLDWMTPQREGIEIAKDILEEKPDANIIMISAKVSEKDIVKAYEIGVKDYMTKPISNKILRKKIAILLDIEENNVNAEVILKDNYRLDVKKKIFYVKTKGYQLTETEFLLAKYLIKHVGTPVSRERILRRVWNIEYTKDNRTVDVNIVSLRKKIGASVLLSQRGVGYYLK